MRHSTILAASWVLPVGALLAILAPWLVRTFYGSEFSPAVGAVWILAAGASLAQVFFWTRPALLALEKADVTLKITTAHAIAKVVLAVTLVPRFGFLGLAAILTLLNVSGVALSLYFIRDSLRIAARGAHGETR